MCECKYRVYVDQNRTVTTAWNPVNNLVAILITEKRFVLTYQLLGFYLIFGIE